MPKKPTKEPEFDREANAVRSAVAYCLTHLRWAARFSIERTVGDEGLAHAASLAFVEKTLIDVETLYRQNRDRYLEIVGRNDELTRQIGKLEARAAAPAKKATPAPARAPAPDKAPVADKACREHDWNTSTTPPVCAVCGKAKSNRGRKSASNPSANVAVATVDGVTKIDPPSLPLPRVAKKTSGVSVELSDGRVIDDLEEDPFEGGTVGAR